MIKLLIFRAFPFIKIIQEAISMRDENGITRSDMIQLMIDTRIKENGKVKMDITEMTAQAFIFFLGGFETTSGQMCLIAHELAINPGIQERLQDEVDSAFMESNGKPTYDQIVNVPLDAVLNESLRLHTQFRFLERVCLSPFELPPALPGGKPYILPKGAAIWIPSCSIHRDPKYHENPLQFDPDRYYNKKVSINDVNNLGFGIGPRSCIGNRFAALEIKIIFFHLLLKFNLKANEKTCNPLTYNKNNFNLTPEGEFSLAALNLEIVKVYEDFR